MSTTLKLAIALVVLALGARLAATVLEAMTLPDASIRIGVVVLLLAAVAAGVLLVAVRPRHPRSG